MKTGASFEGGWKAVAPKEKEKRKKEKKKKKKERKEGTMNNVKHHLFLDANPGVTAPAIKIESITPST